MGGWQRFLSAVAVGLLTSAVILVSGRLDAGSQVLIPIGSLVGTVALIYVLGLTRGGLLAIVLAATVNRYPAEIAGASLKPEHLAVPIVAILLIPQLLRLTRNLEPVDLLLLVWLGWSFVGGFLHAPDAPDSTRLWLMLLLAAFPYFLIVMTVRTSGRLLTVIDGWMLIAISAGLFGIAVHFLYAWGLNLGIQINPSTAEPTVPSSFRESNLFGSAMMMLTLTALSLLALGFQRHRLTVPAIVFGLIGLQLSFTRTAWVAFAIGLLILVSLLALLSVRNAYNLSAKVTRPAIAVVLLSILATVLVWVPIGDPDVRNARADLASEYATREAGVWASATAGATEPAPTLAPLTDSTATTGIVPTPSPMNPDIVGRVGSITDTTDSSVNIRLEFAKRALRDWQEHPLTGWGIGSFGQKYTTTSFDRAWLSNIFVRVLHDGGGIGLLLFLIPFGMLAIAGLRLTDQITGDLDRMALSLGVAVAGMFVAFQATEGFQLAWYWIAVGLYAAATRLAHNRRNRMGPV